MKIEGFQLCLRPVVVYGVSESWRPPSLKPNFRSRFFSELRQVGNGIAGISWVAYVNLHIRCVSQKLCSGRYIRITALADHPSGF